MLMVVKLWHEKEFIIMDLFVIALYEIHAYYMSQLRWFLF